MTSWAYPELFREQPAGPPPRHDPVAAVSAAEHRESWRRAAPAPALQEKSKGQLMIAEPCPAVPDHQMSLLVSSVTSLDQTVAGFVGQTSDRLKHAEERTDELAEILAQISASLKELHSAHSVKAQHAQAAVQAKKPPLKRATAAAVKTEGRGVQGCKVKRVLGNRKAPQLAPSARTNTKSNKRGGTRGALCWQVLVKRAVLKDNFPLDHLLTLRKALKIKGRDVYPVSEAMLKLVGISPLEYPHRKKTGCKWKQYMTAKQLRMAIAESDG